MMKIYKASLLLISLSFVICHGLFAQENDSQAISLFAQPKLVDEYVEPGQEELRRMAVQVNEEIFRPDAINKGDQILVDLFSERTIEGLITRAGTDVLGTTSIQARIPGEVPGTLIITHHGNRLFATLNLYEEDKLFHIKSDPETGAHFLAEMDKSAMEPLKCGGVIMEPIPELEKDLEHEIEVID